MVQPVITVTVQNDRTNYLVRGWRCKITATITTSHTSVRWHIGTYDGEFIRWGPTFSTNDTFEYYLIGDNSIYVGCQIDDLDVNWSNPTLPRTTEAFELLRCQTPPKINATSLSPDIGSIYQTLQLDCSADGAYGYEWYVSRGSGSTPYTVLATDTISETGALTITLGSQYNRWWINTPALYYFWCKVYGYKDGQNYTSWVESTPRMGYTATYAPPEYDSAYVSPQNGVPDASKSLTFVIDSYDSTITQYEWQQYIGGTWTTIGTTTSSQYSKVIDTSTVGIYSFRCILHNSGSSTTTTSTIEYRVYPNGRFICELTFLKYADQFPASTHWYYNVIDFVHKTQEQLVSPDIIKGGFKWSRTNNKNAIYVQLPVESMDEGGYGYDLGFLQDNFTLDYSTNDYWEYYRFMALVKTNTGEKVGVLRIGYAGAVEEYNVIIRYISANGDAGSELIAISCTLTVTTKQYAADA